MGKRAAPDSGTALAKALAILPSVLSLPGVADQHVRSIIGKLDGELQGEDDDRLFRKRSKNMFEKIINETCFDYTMQLSAGVPELLPVADIERLLQWFADGCVCFSGLLESVFKDRRPLTLIVYFDEVTPGNPLRPDNLRKSYLIYVSLKEFKHALKSEFAWLPAMVVKHPLLDKFPGGLSRLLRDVFRLWSGSGLFSHGVVLRFACTSYVVRIVPKVRIYADYAAACSAWDSKTASGIRPCLFCQNVTLLRAGLTDHANRDGYLVPFSCPDPSKFDVIPEAGYSQIASDLSEAAQGTACFLDQTEKAAGFNFSSVGLLQASDLNGFASPARTFVDGMHDIFASGGTANVEVGFFMKAVQDKADGMGLAQIQSVLTASWSKPFIHSRSSDSNNLRECSLLNGKKLADTHYRGNASELLSLLPLLEWTVHSLRPQLQAWEPQVASFLAVCDVARQYMALKFDKSGTLDHSMMDAAVGKHLQLFVQAYGEPALKPKHHLAWHIGPQCAEEGLVIDCWAGERKNGRFKLMVNSGKLKALKGLERSALGRLLNSQKEFLAGVPEIFKDHLGKPQQDCPELASILGTADVKLAKTLQFNMLKLAVDDILLMPGRKAAKVIACVSVGGDLALVLQQFAFLRQEGNATFWQPRCKSDVVRLLGAVALSAFWECTCFL